MCKYSTILKEKQQKSKQFSKPQDTTPQQKKHQKSAHITQPPQPQQKTP